MFIIDDLIKGAMDMGTASLSNYQQYNYQSRLAEDQFGYQKKLLENQNNYNVDMYNRANEYNAPGAQAQRFADAGFNPAMAMGQGATAASAPSSANPSFSMPSFSATPLPSIVETLKGLEEIRNMRKQEEKTSAEIKKTLQEAASEFFNTRIAEFNANKQSEEWDKNKAILDETITKLHNEGLLSAEEASYYKEQTYWLGQKSPEEINQILETISLMKEQVNTELTKQTANRASAAASSATASYMREQAQTEREFRDIRKEGFKVDNLGKVIVNNKVASEAVQAKYHAIKSKIEALAESNKTAFDNACRMYGINPSVTGWNKAIELMVGRLLRFGDWQESVDKAFDDQKGPVEPVSQNSPADILENLLSNQFKKLYAYEVSGNRHYKTHRNPLSFKMMT